MTRPFLARVASALAVLVLVAACSSGTSGAGPNATAPTPGPSVAASGATASGGPAHAACPTSQPAPLPADEKRTVTIETSKGSFDIEIDGSLSPIATGNFVALAECGFYDGVVFHRIATLQDGTPFVIQGGDPTGTGTGGPGYTIQDEPVTAQYKRGTVAMARSSQPNSVGSQFFIVLDDKDESILSAYNTYQIIGTVTQGMDTVDAIYAAAKGHENPADPVAMTKVTVSAP